MGNEFCRRFQKGSSHHGDDFHYAHGRAEKKLEGETIEKYDIIPTALDLRTGEVLDQPKQLEAAENQPGKRMPNWPPYDLNEDEVSAQCVGGGVRPTEVGTTFETPNEEKPPKCTHPAISPIQFHPEFSTHHKGGGLSPSAKTTIEPLSDIANKTKDKSPAQKGGE